MRWFRTISIVLLSAVAWCQAPVLRPLEPADNRFISLPGAKVVKTVKTLKPPAVIAVPLPPPKELAAPTLPAAPSVELALDKLSTERLNSKGWKLSTERARCSRRSR